MLNEKDVNRLDTRSIMWPRPFDLTHDPELRFLKVKSQNRCILGIVIWLLWNKKKQIN